MIIWPGLRRSVSAIQRLFNSASFYAPLTHSLVPERGTGSPTFTRATTETGQKWDEAGYLDFTALAGEVVFKGARRVRNWIVAPTENWASAGWVKSGISVSGNRLTATGANGIIYDNAAAAMGAGKTAVGSITLSRVTGTGDIQISTNGGATYQTVLANGSRVSVVSTGSNNGQFVLKIVTNGDAVDATYPQLEDVTGQTTQTAGEYVSVGALDYRSELNRLYLSLPGSSGNYLSTPDSAANSITGDISFVVNAALIDWTPEVVYQPFFAKRGVNSYQLAVTPPSSGPKGTLRLNWWDSGGTLRTAESTAIVPGVDGQPLRVACTLDVDNGGGGNTVKFFTSADGATWTQLGSAVAQGFVTSVQNTADPLYIGADAAVSPSSIGGKIFSAQIYNGIPPMLSGSGSATPVVDFNPHRDAVTPTGTFTSSTTGEVWTINGASSVVRSDYYHGSFVDGVKCFNTDIAGNAIPSTTLLGYQAQGARTNLCLQSNAFTTTWVNGGLASITQNATGPDGGTTAWTLTDSSVIGAPYITQDITLTAASYTMSVFVKKTTGAQASYPVILFFLAATTGMAGVTIDTSNGVATAWTAYTGFTGVNGSATCVSYNSNFWRVSLTFTGTAAAWTLRLYPAGTTNATQSTGTLDNAVTGSAVFYGAQVELGSFATPYIPTTTVAVARNAPVDQYPTTAGPIAAAGSIALDFTPYHAPSGTIALWGTYVDASNYTAILHDATNLIFRKRIAGSNYDATIANAFVSGTTYKVAATWGAAGTAIYLDGVAGTPHANTTAAQIAATMQVGADGNSLQQPGAGTTNLRIWQRQLSSPEGVAVTA